MFCFFGTIKCNTHYIFYYKRCVQKVPGLKNSLPELCSSRLKITLIWMDGFQSSCYVLHHSLPYGFHQTSHTLANSSFETGSIFEGRILTGDEIWISGCDWLFFKFSVVRWEARPKHHHHFFSIYSIVHHGFIHQHNAVEAKLNSIEISFIYTAPNNDNSRLKTLYIIR